ncbi:hypothetical protein RQP46_001079 [Phenoliferia psychrophenolica]
MLKLTRLLRPVARPSPFAASFSCSCAARAAPPASPSAPSPAPARAASAAPTRRRTDLDSRKLRYLNSLSDLAAFDPTLDLHPDRIFSTGFTTGNKHALTVARVNENPNQPDVSQPRPPTAMLAGLPGEDDSVEHLAQVTDLSPNEIRSLVRFPLIVKRVVNMKSKGKMPSMYALVVVGNQNGLVGVGEGKDETANRAVTKAFNQAVRSMDYVDRYEDRTVWGTMESNFGSCAIEMRSRPPGFGLRVNHYLHQVAKAAGISDLSAKVYGSRNGTRVIKLACQMLHGGSVPIDMGEFGHKGQRRNKKVTGMRSAEEVGRTRGRLAVSL